MRYEIYEHHGVKVWVRSDQKNQHRDRCLCWNCANFHPGAEYNCIKAKALRALCVEQQLTAPVFECPAFVMLQGQYAPGSEPKETKEG